MGQNKRLLPHSPGLYPSKEIFLLICHHYTIALGWRPFITGSNASLVQVFSFAFKSLYKSLHGLCNYIGLFLPFFPLYSSILTGGLQRCITCSICKKVTELGTSTNYFFFFPLSLFMQKKSFSLE